MTITAVHPTTATATARGTAQDTGQHQAARDTRAGQAQPRVSVIIPTLNEARNLEHVFAALPAGLHEVILVDGHSTDGTPDVARTLMPAIRIVNQTRKGKGNALACGFAAATGDIIVMIDADGSTDPAEIHRYVHALTSGADFHGESNLNTRRHRREPSALSLRPATTGQKLSADAILTHLSDKSGRTTPCSCGPAPGVPSGTTGVKVTRNFGAVSRPRARRAAGRERGRGRSGERLVP